MPGYRELGSILYGTGVMMRTRHNCGLGSRSIFSGLTLIVVVLIAHMFLYRAGVVIGGAQAK